MFELFCFIFMTVVHKLDFTNIAVEYIRICAQNAYNTDSFVC